MKKFLSVILTVSLIFHFFSIPASAAEKIQPEYVQAMINRGIITSDEKLDVLLSREEAVLYLAKMISMIPDSEKWIDYKGESVFQDIGQIKYKGAVMYLVEKKIITGYTSASGQYYFSPDEAISYMDAQIIILRAIVGMASVSQWNYLEKATELGIISSKENLGLYDDITREVFLELLYKAFPAESSVMLTTSKLTGYKFKLGYSKEGTAFVKWGDAGYTMINLTLKMDAAVNETNITYFTHDELIPPREFKGGDVEILAFSDSVVLFEIPGMELTSLDISELSNIKVFDAQNNKLTEISLPGNITEVIKFNVSGNGVDYSKLPVNVSSSGDIVTDESSEYIVSQIDKIKSGLIDSSDYTSVMYDSAKISLSFRAAGEAEKNIKKEILDSIADALSDNISGKSSVGSYFTLSLEKTVGKTSSGITKLSAPIKVTIDAGKKISGVNSYYIVISDGAVSKIISCDYSAEKNTLTFETDMLGTAAVIFRPGSEYQLAFTDINDTHWAYGYVTKITSLGIMEGLSEVIFAPEAPMTREMFVSSLAKAAEADTTDPVKWAVDKKILLGGTGGDLMLEDAITREQMAVMFERYFSGSPISLNTSSPLVDKFSDASSVSSWAVSAVELMRVTGLISGRENARFAPQETFSRAEAATVLCRLLEMGMG